MPNHHGILTTELQSMEVQMFRRSRAVIPRNMTCVAKRLAQPATKSKLLHTMRVVGPTFVALSFDGVANAQRTMDFSGARTLMGTFKTIAIYSGTVVCFSGLIFAGIRMLSGRSSDAIPGLFGAQFGAGVLGWRTSAARPGG
jgi:hypothetical protein